MSQQNVNIQINKSNEQADNNIIGIPIFNPDGYIRLMQPHNYGKIVGKVDVSRR